LYHTFREAYLLVDDGTRKKFIDLFKTWKTAKTSSGLPLFPEEPVNKIEQFLIKASNLYQQSAPQPQLTVPMLLATVDKLQYLTNQRLMASPDDQTIQQKMQVIGQLKYALQTEPMPQLTLASVKAELDEMTKTEERLLRETPPVRSPHVRSPALVQPQPNLQNIFNSIQPNYNNRSGTMTPVEDKPAPPKSSDKNPLGLLNSILNLKQPTIKSPTQKRDLSSLLFSLEKSGLVKKPQQSSKIPSAALLSSLLQRQTKSATPQPQETQSLVQSELGKYDIASKFISLDPTATYFSLFVTSRTNKCGTCGKRFLDTPEGSAKSREHLDWHFRINKKLREGTVVQSRSWYLDDEDFVKFRDEEMFGSADNIGDMEKQTEKVKKERHYVIVPSDSDMSCVCGVCKEVLRAKFDDDLGEWIWEDAVEKQGRVFHHACFEETQNNGSSSTVLGNKRQRDTSALDFDLLKNVVKNVRLSDGPRPTE
jgi:pre-mRNA cleavage complex 2 protein Pcf11